MPTGDNPRNNPPFTLQNLHRAGVFGGVRLIYNAMTMEVVDFIDFLGNLDDENEHANNIP
uniref:Uncharacterized protein n=1 Tax=Romanomermis culicivorax TaxID=13658 RepID=A0A915IND4_ROMCU